MIKRPIREDWRPYLQNDPDTWPSADERRFYGYYEVTVSYVTGGRDVVLAGNFSESFPPKDRWRNTQRGTSISDVIAWRRQPLSEPWSGER